METAIGEEMTVRVMQFDGGQVPVLANKRTGMEPMGGMMFNNRCSGSFDNIF